MTQSQINFDLPAQRHSPTSVAAAEAHGPHAAAYEAIALEAFRVAGESGLTDDELMGVMHGYKSARPRRVGLFRKGKIKDSGRTRPSNAGHPMTVWTFTGAL